MTQNKKLGFGATDKLTVRVVLERLSDTFRGAIVVSGLFLYTQEIPNVVFVLLIAGSIVLVNIYLAITDKSE